MNKQTVQEIQHLLQAADAREFAVLKRSLEADTRKSVQQALKVAQRRLEAEERESARLQSMYDVPWALSNGGVCIGLDEVGRGPLAGPLTVGAVVLPQTPHIAGLNDSKQVPEAKRPEIAQAIKDVALAWSIQHIEPDHLDAAGMTASLRVAFLRAIADIENQGVHADVILLDGNPMHLDDREINVIKGDAKCACIAAGSIIAKVERDARMVAYDDIYPGYGFAHNKGYASQAHQDAIRELGLSPIHRVSFCSAFTQESLF